MSAFDEAKKVEARSLEILTPFIRARSNGGQFILIEKGRLALELQRQIGDAAFNARDGVLWTVEVKAEEENKYGNFFLETWSNRARYTMGWMVTLNSDLLLYHFLKSDELYVMNFQNLKRWAWWERRIYRYPEREQGKREQLNDTWGRCVPISVISREVGFRRFIASTGEPYHARVETAVEVAA